MGQHVTFIKPMTAADVLKRQTLTGHHHQSQLWITLMDLTVKNFTVLCKIFDCQIHDQVLDF